MVVDYERAWLALKEVVVAKRSHGQDGLLAEMTRIELESRVDSPGIDPTPLPPTGNGAREPALTTPDSGS